MSGPAYPTGCIIPSTPDPRTLQASDYTDLMAGSYPDKIQWAKNIPTTPNPSGRPWSPKGNNIFSNCTTAACANIVKVQCWNNGTDQQRKTRHTDDPPDAKVLEAYWRTAGLPDTTPAPGPGLMSTSAFRDWRVNGLGVHQHRLSSYIAFPFYVQNDEMLCRALFTFGPLYWELTCPDSMFTQTKMVNTPWSVVDGDAGIPKWGHALVLMGAHDGIYECVSWGFLKKCTPEFFWKYVQGIYALLTPDWKPLGDVDTDKIKKDTAKVVKAG